MTPPEISFTLANQGRDSHVIYDMTGNAPPTVMSGADHLVDSSFNVFIGSTLASSNFVFSAETLPSMGLSDEIADAEPVRANRFSIARRLSITHETNRLLFNLAMLDASLREHGTPSDKNFLQIFSFLFRKIENDPHRIEPNREIREEVKQYIYQLLLLMSTGETTLEACNGNERFVELSRNLRGREIRAFANSVDLLLTPQYHVFLGRILYSFLKESGFPDSENIVPCLKNYLRCHTTTYWLNDPYDQIIRNLLRQQPINIQHTVFFLMKIAQYIPVDQSQTFNNIMQQVLTVLHPFGSGLCTLELKELRDVSIQAIDKFLERLARVSGDPQTLPDLKYKFTKMYCVDFEHIFQMSYSNGQCKGGHYFSPESVELSVKRFSGLCEIKKPSIVVATQAYHPIMSLGISCYQGVTDDMRLIEKYKLSTSFFLMSKEQIARAIKYVLKHHILVPIEKHDKTEYFGTFPKEAGVEIPIVLWVNEIEKTISSAYPVFFQEHFLYIEEDTLPNTILLGGDFSSTKGTLVSPPILPPREDYIMSLDNQLSPILQKRKEMEIRPPEARRELTEKELIRLKRSWIHDVSRMDENEKRMALKRAILRAIIAKNQRNVADKLAANPEANIVNIDILPPTASHEHLFGWKEPVSKETTMQYFQQVIRTMRKQRRPVSLTESQIEAALHDIYNGGLTRYCFVNLNKVDLTKF